jgi:hypothetical protein
VEEEEGAYFEECWVVQVLRSMFFNIVDYEVLYLTIIGAKPLTLGTKLEVRTEKKKRVRLPGIEPGSKAWKASMLTITPQTPEWIATPTRETRP